MIPRKFGFGVLLVLCVGSVSLAEVRLPGIFSDHMVLQRDTKLPIWGWAEPGEQVTVTLNDQQQTTKADEQGNWRVKLEPEKASREAKLTIAGANKIELQDVAIGEVWVCSGQSNMAWPIANSWNSELTLAAAEDPDVRLVSVNSKTSKTPLDDFPSKWQRSSAQSVNQFSAVGYYFGKRLADTLDVPIGLIDNAWGGSSCESWTPLATLEADPQYEPLLASWAKRDAEQDPSEHHKRGHQRPGNLYNGRIRPILTYGIRGAIWYQGESNAGRGAQYQELFPLMIQTWRDTWGQGEFPFYWVQLADFRTEQTGPEESSWSELREAQTLTQDRLPNTGQAVIIDLGEAADIHPRNKQEVANRLARWALAEQYGLKIVCRSPRNESWRSSGTKQLSRSRTYRNDFGPWTPDRSKDSPSPAPIASGMRPRRRWWARSVSRCGVRTWPSLSPSVMRGPTTRFATYTTPAVYPSHPSEPTTGQPNPKSNATPEPSACPFS